VNRHGMIIIPTLLAACSYSATDGTSTTHWSLGGRGEVRAPGFEAAHNNDHSLDALVDAARKTITAKVVVDGINQLSDNYYDNEAVDTDAALQSQSISAQERVRLETLRQNTRRLQFAE